MISSQRVRPIKAELIKLRRRRALAYKVKEVLSERLVVLTNELIARANEAKILRRKTNEALKLCISKYLTARAYLGSGVDSIVGAGVLSLSVDKYTENILGVKIPVTRLSIDDKGVLGRAGLGDLVNDFNDFLYYLNQLARAENSIRMLYNEIRKTKRKVNALEYIIIPNINAAIKAISMKFDEKEREEKTRMKRVKTMLERKRK